MGFGFITRLDSITPVMSHFPHLSRTVPSQIKFLLIVFGVTKLTSEPLEALSTGCFSLSIGFISPGNR
jgi:hypothetical protein